MILRLGFEIERLSSWDIALYCSKFCYVYNFNIKSIYSILLFRSVSGKAFDQLFLPNDELVIMRGTAGMGKSTLIDMFTFKWAKRELQDQDFDFVFKFTCREINEIADQVHSLEDLFKKKFPEIFDIIDFQDLGELSERVLIIVDGLDELKDINQMKGEKTQEPYLRVVFDLINTESNKMPFKNHKTFVCGRPEACELVKKQVPQTCKTKMMEIFGFNEENIQKYIFNFFKKDKVKANQVQRTINLSSHLKIMSSVPLFLWVICSVYNENLLDEPINTNAELYFYSCLILLRNHLHTSSLNKNYINLIDIVNDRNIIEIVYSLMLLSVKTYMKGQVIFTDDDIREFLNCQVHLEKTGFIVKYSDNNTGQVKYQFRHLILQEFLCALYICVTKDIAEYKGNTEQRSCIPTIHGIHKIQKSSQNEVYKKFFSALKERHSNRNSRWTEKIKSPMKAKDKDFEKFIYKTSTFIRESMIQGNVMVIDVKSQDCRDYLDAFKETNNYPFTPTRIRSVKIDLHSYNTYKSTIINLMNRLKTKKIKIPECMIEGSCNGTRILLIDESNQDCIQFLRILRDGNFEIDAPDMEVANIRLHTTVTSFKDIIYLLDRFEIKKLRIPDIMVEEVSSGNTKVVLIDDKNTSCRQFLDLLKERRDLQIDAPISDIGSAKIKLNTYKDYKHILDFLARLRITTLEILSIKEFDLLSCDEVFVKILKTTDLMNGDLLISNFHEDTVDVDYTAYGRVPESDLDDFDTYVLL